MAEGGAPTRRVVYIQPVINIQGLSLDDTTIVNGDQHFGPRYDINARNIGVISTAQEEGVQGPAQIDEEVFVEEVEQMNLTGTKSDSVTKPKLNFKSLILSDRARLFIAKSDYEGAVKLLEDSSIRDDVHANLTLAECYLYLWMNENAVKAIDTVRKLLMTSSGLNASEVCSYAKDSRKNSFHIRAMILFRIASDMYKLKIPSPEGVVKKLRYCAYQLYLCLKPLIEAGTRSYDIAVDFGIAYISEMTVAISSVTNVNPEEKVLNEQDCLNLLGACYLYEEEYEKSLEHFQKGVEMLEKQFNSNASNYKFYGNLLHNIGAVFFATENFFLAEKYLVKAEDAYKKSLDYDDEDTKRSCIQAIENNLKQVRSKLGKR